MTERISDKALEGMCKKQERENIKRKESSYSWITIKDIICKGYLEEQELDTKMLILIDGWRQHLKEIV